MPYILLRASTALLIAISASVGVQKAQINSDSSLNPAASPAVLSAQIESIATSSASPAQTASPSATNTPTVAPVATLAPTPTPIPLTKEQKQAKLRAFLKKYNSPLVDSTNDFIDASEQYNVDWKLVPSITGVESTFGKFLPAGSYNAYGWGGGLIRFESWRDSIHTVTKALAEKYIARGLTTPMLIQRVYAPPSTTWGNKVTYFMTLLEHTEPESESTASATPTPTNTPQH